MQQLKVFEVLAEQKSLVFVPEFPSQYTGRGGLAMRDYSLNVLKVKTL